MKRIRDIKKGRKDMSIGEIVLLSVFILGMSIFLIGAGIAIVWMVIEDTMLGKWIDEMIWERANKWRWKNHDEN